MRPDDPEEGSEQAKSDFGNEAWSHESQTLGKGLQSVNDLREIVILSSQ